VFLQNALFLIVFVGKDYIAYEDLERTNEGSSFEGKLEQTSSKKLLQLLPLFPCGS